MTAMASAMMFSGRSIATIPYARFVENDHSSASDGRKDALSWARLIVILVLQHCPIRSCLKGTSYNRTTYDFTIIAL
jgi:hypothetical protein